MIHFRSVGWGGSFPGAGARLRAFSDSQTAYLGRWPQRWTGLIISTPYAYLRRIGLYSSVIAARMKTLKR